jgi:transposase
VTDHTPHHDPSSSSLGADTEEARRATGVSAPSASTRIASEVLERAARRRFTADYKQRILTEADACAEPGALGHLLRREGLYSSHLSAWRKQRDEGIHEALSRPRGRKPVEKSPLTHEVARLQAENQRLQFRLTQAQTIIEVQKKLSLLLGLELPPTSGMAS